MVRIENQCCGCATPGYPCLGSACSLTSVEVRVCDECECEIDEDDTYIVDDQELCEYCVLDRFRKKKEI